MLLGAASNVDPKGLEVYRSHTGFVQVSCWYEDRKKYLSVNLSKRGCGVFCCWTRPEIKCYYIFLSLESKTQQNLIFGGHQGEKEDAAKPF